MGEQIVRVTVTPEVLAGIKDRLRNSRAMTMTWEEIDAARHDDPDAIPPMTDEEIAAEAATTVREAREATGLSRQEFSMAYGIPIRALQAWEEGREEPDATGRAYLRAIRRNPEAVASAYAG